MLLVYYRLTLLSVSLDNYWSRMSSQTLIIQSRQEVLINCLILCILSLWQHLQISRALLIWAFANGWQRFDRSLLIESLYISVVHFI